jgi:hypothetical protein
MRNSLEIGKRDSCFLFYLRCTTTTAYRRLNYFLIPHPSWNYSHLVASHFSASRFDYALVFFSFFPGLRAYRLTTGVVQPGDSQMTHIREKYIPIHTRGLDLNSFKYYKKRSEHVKDSSVCLCTWSNLILAI